MSPSPPTTATPVASNHQHHRYPSPHHPHRLPLAIISPTRKPPSVTPPRHAVKMHHQEGPTSIRLVYAKRIKGADGLAVNTKR
ncbi:hypothetical protein Tco_0809752 [Tanacetum coccineum]